MVDQRGRHGGATDVDRLVVSKPKGERQQVTCVLPYFRMTLSGLGPERTEVGSPGVAQSLNERVGQPRAFSPRASCSRQPQLGAGARVRTSSELVVETVAAPARRAANRKAVTVTHRATRVGVALRAREDSGALCRLGSSVPARRCLAHGQSLQFTPQRTPISIPGRCRSVYAAYRFTAKLRASSEVDACIAPVLTSLADSHP